MEGLLIFAVFFINVIFAFTFKNLAIDNGHSDEANYCFWISLFFPWAGYNYVAGLPKLSREEIDEDKRYKTITYVGENLYIDKSPVAIMGGKLMQDKFTLQYILKIRLLNVSEKTINKVACSISAVDRFYENIVSMDYEYENLTAKEDDIFTEKEKIKLVKNDKNDKIFSLQIEIKEVTFQDGSSWSSGDERFRKLEDVVR